MELFFKRKLTSKLPEFTEGGESQMNIILQQVRDRDSEKQQAKHYADTYEMTAHYGDQVVLKSPQGIEYKRNLQHITRVVTEPVADAECSTECGGDTPEPAPSLELTDQSTQETTTTGVAVAGTPCRSGRVSQPPKALADYVLY